MSYYSTKHSSWGNLLAPDLVNPKRSVGPEGFVMIRRYYKDARNMRVKIMGWSREDGGFLGLDNEGVIRVYDVDGNCTFKHNGQPNEDTYKGKELVYKKRDDLHLLKRD